MYGSYELDVAEVALMMVYMYDTLNGAVVTGIK